MGLEPTVSALGGPRLIHWATSAKVNNSAYGKLMKETKRIHSIYFDKLHFFLK